MFGRKRVVIWLNVPRCWRWLLLAAAVLVLAFNLMQEYPEEPSWTALPLSGQIVAVDAGHGGRDGGAVSADGLVEKDITLKIALLLRDYLQEAGAVVVMTREDDRELTNPGVKGRKRQDLTKRAEMINDSGADLMVSIHLNSIHSSRWRGAQTFYQPNRGKEHETLAKLIQDELIRNLENTDRQAKPLDRNILLMRSVEMPAALVEAGFLSNPDEARLLNSPDYQKKVAAAIYRGILRFASGEQLE